MRRKTKLCLLILMLVLSIFFSSASVLAASASIRLNKSSVTITAAKTFALKATVKGASKKVSWSSSNKRIATVSSKGLVKGIKAGTATITARANGKTARCKVTVKAAPIEISGYRGKSIAAVKKKFPGWTGYKQRFMEFWSDSSNGVRFIAPNTDYYNPDNHYVTVMDLQPNATRKYSICGLQIGMTRSAALSTAKKNYH